MNQQDKENLLAAIIRMEHKGGYMNMIEYRSTASLATELGAPQFIVDYFAEKANQPEQG